MSKSVEKKVEYDYAKAVRRLEELYRFSMGKDDIKTALQISKELTQPPDSPKIPYWSMIDTINQLIPSKSLEKASKRIKQETGYVSMGIDVARYGEDKTVFVVLILGNIELIETYQQTSTTQVVTRAIELMQEYNIDPKHTGIDAVGIGTGVIDQLKGMGYNVMEIIGGAKAEELEYEDNFQPFNLRSQMYYELRREFVNENIGNLNNQTLKLELASIQYEISAERTVKVAGKDVIKKVLGKFPDLADALCYANWAKNNYDISDYCLPICGGV